MNCIFENLDASTFSANDKLECRVGVMRIVPALRDWSVAEVPLLDYSADVDTAVGGWRCVDMHQPEDALAEPPVVDAGGYQNCYIYREGSNIVNGETLESGATARRLDSDNSGTGTQGT